MEGLAAGAEIGGGARLGLLLAERMPVPAWLCGPGGRLEYANEAWLAYTGRRAEEEAGLGWLDSVHPDDRGGCLAAVEAAWERREPFAVRFRLRRRDGAYRWVEDRGAPVADAAGAFAGLACCAVEDHRRELLRRALARAARALGRRDVLLAELHHRFKNTLQMVGGLLAALARGVPEGSRAAVREAARRVRALTLAQEALRPAPDPGGAAATVELGRYLADVTAGLRELAQARDVRVEVRAEPGLGLPVQRAAPLGLAVNELVTNALKHAFPGDRAGSVAVEARRLANGRVEVAVADDGAGLPDRAWPPAAGASSLGLPLVAGLARQAGAEVSVGGAAGGGGTRFALALAADPARAA